MRPDGTHFGNLSSDICGDLYGGMKIAHMVTGDGVGFELFQFLEPAPERRSGHDGILEERLLPHRHHRPDVDAKVAEIVETGGLQRSKIWNLFPDEPIRICYCEDPFGNVIEIMSQRYEQVLANRGE